MKKALLFLAITSGNCVAQDKITVLFTDITNSKVDTVFFQVDSFPSDCSTMDGSSLHVIPGPTFNKSNSPVDNKVYLPVYDIIWEKHPIMGNLLTWTDYYSNFECTARYLYKNKDLYISK